MLDNGTTSVKESSDHIFMRNGQQKWTDENISSPDSTIAGNESLIDNEECSRGKSNFLMSGVGLRVSLTCIIQFIWIPRLCCFSRGQQCTIPRKLPMWDVTLALPNGEILASYFSP